MKKPDNEKIYRTIASRYQRETGEQLLREKAMLEQQSPGADTRRLDELVRRGTSRRKKIKTARWTAVIAACLLVLVLVPLWGPLLTKMGQSDSARVNESAAAEAPNGAAASEAQPGQEELIPLHFTLPDNFTVEKAELDNGLSVYHLGDSCRDPVVMQLGYSDAYELQTDGLTQLTVNGQPVYGRSGDAYHLLTFESGGIVYTLTCAYDINTLVPICENIL